MKKILIGLLILALISGCASPPQNTTSNSTENSTVQTHIALCQFNNGLPDPNCTAGSIDTAVNQNNIQETICIAGYTEKIRPSTSYTDSLKNVSIRDYNYADMDMSDYEEDHLIPLELGGNPVTVNNLWAEPYYGQYNAKDKDKLENYLHKQVCDGIMNLAEAQKEISTNWIQYYNEYGLAS